MEQRRDHEGEAGGEEQREPARRRLRGSATRGSAAARPPRCRGSRRRRTAATSGCRRAELRTTIVGPSAWKNDAVMNAHRRRSGTASPNSRRPECGGRLTFGCHHAYGRRSVTVSRISTIPTNAGTRSDEADDEDEPQRPRPVLHEQSADDRPDREPGDGGRRGVGRRPARVPVRLEVGERRRRRAREDADREAGEDAGRQQEPETVREHVPDEAERGERECRAAGPAADRPRRRCRRGTAPRPSPRRSSPRRAG